MPNVGHAQHAFHVRKRNHKWVELES